jgi:hypothetical protein
MTELRPIRPSDINRLPKSDILDIAAQARRHADNAIAALGAIAVDPDASSSARVAAAALLLDRGFGRVSLRAELPPPVIVADFTIDDVLAARAKLLDEV